MAEFINLDDETPETILHYPSPLEFMQDSEDSEIILHCVPELECIQDPKNNNINITNLSSIFIEEVNNNTSDDQDNHCDTCEPADFYGDTNPDGSFKKDNLFSELTNDYERAVARKNLGIIEEGSVKKDYEPIYYGIFLDYNQNSKIENKEFILNCGDDDYGYIYIPSDLSDRIAVNNIVGGFTIFDIITIKGIIYSIYRTAHKGLGQLHITIL